MRTLTELMDAHHLSTFSELIRVAGLQDTFNNAGDNTVFVPSEDAFYCKPKIFHIFYLDLSGS